MHGAERHSLGGVHSRCAPEAHHHIDAVLVNATHALDDGIVGALGNASVLHHRTTSRAHRHGNPLQRAVQPRRGATAHQEHRAGGGNLRQLLQGRLARNDAHRIVKREIPHPLLPFFSKRGALPRGNAPAKHLWSSMRAKPAAWPRACAIAKVVPYGACGRRRERRQGRPSRWRLRRSTPGAVRKAAAPDVLRRYRLSFKRATRSSRVRGAKAVGRSAMVSATSST